MKLIFSLLLTINLITGFAQESFKKKYYIKSKIEEIHLKQDSIIKYKDLDQKSRDSIDQIFKRGDEITLTVEQKISGQKVLATTKSVIDDSFLEKQGVSRSFNVSLPSGAQGYVKFDEDKLIVNPHLLKKNGNYSRRKLYYYQFKNRQSINLVFSEFTVSALTIPLKYRFKDKSKNISEEFSANFSGNIFAGYAIGKSTFFYREKVGNITNTRKWTVGFLLGASTVTLNSSNTSSSENPLAEGSEITKGLGSVGFGLTRTYNKINFGLFYGWDYSIGDTAEKWDYNKKPWLGVAVGYSLFNF